MKIDSNVLFPSDSQPERVKSGSSSKTSSGSQGTSGSSGLSSAAGEDTVNLSSTHGDVQVLAAGLQEVPDVRASRVQALQQQVQSGQYQPDSGQVADAIIADHSRGNAKA